MNVRTRGIWKMTLWVTLLLAVFPPIVGRTANSKPTVKITTPKANAKIAANETFSIQVSGLAKSGINIDHVEITLINANGSEAGILADGTETWSKTLLGLVPGKNQVSAIAVDEEGRASNPVSVSFNFVATGQISVSSTTGGSVSGVADGDLVLLGSLIRAKAKPARGFLFQSWTVAAADGQNPEPVLTPTLVVPMIDGLVLHAEFTPNPFVSLKGPYSLLLQDSADQPVGTVTGALTASGAITLKVTIGGVSYRGRGKFDGLGNAKIPLKRRGLPPLDLVLLLGLDDEASGLQAWVYSEDNELESSGSSIQNDATVAAANINAIIASDPLHPDSPQGNGYARIRVTKSKSAAVTGKLADGTPFSAGGKLGRNSQLPFHTLLFKGEGYIAGEFEFSHNPDTDLAQVKGPLKWSKNAGQGTNYPAGFEASPTLAGSKYTAPKRNTRVIEVADTEENVEFAAYGGALGVTLVVPATLSRKNKVEARNTAEELTIKIDAARGGFRGSFIEPENSTVVDFEGVFMQDSNLGTGFFLLNGESGTVSFTGF